MLLDSAGATRAAERPGGARRGLRPESTPGKMMKERSQHSRGSDAVEVLLELADELEEQGRDLLRQARELQKVAQRLGGGEGSGARPARPGRSPAADRRPSARPARDRDGGGDSGDGLEGWSNAPQRRPASGGRAGGGAPRGGPRERSGERSFGPRGRGTGGGFSGDREGGWGGGSREGGSRGTGSRARGDTRPTRGEGGAPEGGGSKPRRGPGPKPDWTPRGRRK